MGPGGAGGGVASPQALMLSLWQAVGMCMTLISPLQCVHRPHF